MTELQIKNAVEKFEALIREQSDRSDTIKAQGDFIDYEKLDKIVIGVCGGDGIGPIITKSFARIHCANLVNAGIIPFTFADEADYDKISVNDELCLENIRDSIANGTDVTLKNLTTGESYKLDYQLSERQRDILLAGGLLDYTRESQN